MDALPLMSTPTLAMGGKLGDEKASSLLEFILITLLPLKSLLLK